MSKDERRMLADGMGLREEGGSRRQRAGAGFIKGGLAKILRAK